MIAITILWWGTWTYNVLQALRKLDGIKISSIISMSDDGWSTWLLRDEYGILPPWDLRRWIVALSDEEKSWILRDLFNYRFSWWWLHWHNLGNLMLMALQDITWNYAKAIDSLEEILDLKGKIYPVTFERSRLLAILENNKFVFGETNIDVPKHDGSLKIKKFHVIRDKYFRMLETLTDESVNMSKDIVDQILETVVSDVPQENPKIETVINDSDYILLWPGDIYTSVLPNILVGNVREYIVNSKAKKVLFANLFTKYWETTGFKLSNFIAEYEYYLGSWVIDYILIQDYDNYPIDSDIKERYRLEWKEPMEVDVFDHRMIKWDFVKLSDMARHDPNKIAIVLKNLLS